MAAKTPAGRYPCGFCSTRHHGLCPGTIRNGSQAAQPTWTCPCSEQGHTLGGQPPRHVDVARRPVSPRTAPRPAEDVRAPALAGPGPARKRGKAPAPFPEGVCSPYRFRAALLERGLVTASFRPQTVYTWVAKAGKGGSFPVRWYGPDGAIVDADADAAGARPGVPVDEAAAWFTAQQAA